MRLRAVFLDFHGTLLDPESARPAQVALVQALVRRFALADDPGVLLERLEAHRGRYYAHQRGYWTGQEIIEDATLEFLRAHGVDATVEDMEWWGELYRQTHREHLRLYPDAQAFLSALRPWGVHVGLVSDIDVAFLELVRGSLGLDPYFDAYTSSEEVGASKPDPRPFRTALAKAGVDPSEAVHIGDKPDRDVAGARALGMATILRRRPGVDPGGSADHMVDDLRDALPILQAYLGGPP